LSIDKILAARIKRVSNVRNSAPLVPFICQLIQRP